MSNPLQGLNDSQKKAVSTIDGPVLIVAGPGTGKTLTIVRRIAYLINQGVKPEKILTVTFTNRAAREMEERAEALLGSHAKKLFIGTFHLLGLSIIRNTLSGNFTIYNRDEQVSLLKPLLKGSNIKPQEAIERISRVKNLIDDADEEIKNICKGYQSALDKNAAIDFDDLILKPIEMLSSVDIFTYYREKFTYLIVDEYQDINPAQYRLLRLLSEGNANLCAVGDPDQAIYAFRGADIANFLSFEKDFKDARRIALAENYRSTGAILNASSNMIKKNQNRIEKELCPTRGEGKLVPLVSAPDDMAEGEFIVKEIEARIGGTSHYQMTRTKEMNGCSGEAYRFSDFAVIYRTNAQARAIEEAFLASGIPYQVIGKGISKQGREIEDTVSYMKSVIKPLDDTAEPEQAPLEKKLLITADIFDPRADAVTLMTLHMAKGLEFKVVFIAGVEDGLIPYTLRKDSADIEEERRLFYVGMTRAKDELFLVHARERFLYGQRLSQRPSSFLKEIPEELIQKRAIPDRIKKQKQEKQIGLF